MLTFKILAMWNKKGVKLHFLGNPCNKHIKECSASSSTNKFTKYNVDESCMKLAEMASTKFILSYLLQKFKEEYVMDQQQYSVCWIIYPQ